jgi:hypothetical protein
MSASDQVGPVLHAGALGAAVAAAIRDLNPAAQIVDRGSYLRVLVPSRCRLTPAAVEARTGQPFALPADLERVLSAHKGVFTVNQEEALWVAPREGAR